MRRRRFLGALAGGILLTGCTARTDSVADPANGTGSTDDTDHLGFGDSTVVDFETVPLTATVAGGHVRTVDGLSMTIEFTDPATVDSPATLAATIRNERSYPQTLDPRRLPVLDDPPVGRADEDGTVSLAPADDHPLAETTPGYDRDDDGRWRLEHARGDWFPETIALEAEETIVGEHYLLGHHGTDEPPIEAGRYRFRRSDNAFTVAVWPTDEPGPDGDPRFAGADPPSLPDEDDVRWYHDATPATEVFLEPDAESVAAPARIGFDLVNHGREALSGNPYDWRLYKLDDGEWFPVDPWLWPTPLSSLGPGAVDERELALYAGEPIDRDGERTVGHLGGGRYAYAVGYSTDGETHAAMFDLEAPPLSVDPEADATVDDDGDSVVVRLPNYEDARRPATFTVRRADSAISGEAAERIVLEQLPRRPFRGFRNSLPLFESGVETVRVKTDRGTALGPFDYEKSVTRTIEFEDSLFEATAALEPQ